MSFKVSERGTNRKLVYKLLYSNFRRITDRFREIQAVSMLKTTRCLPRLTLNLKVMLLEYGDEIWRQKTRIMGCHMVKKS